MITELPSRIGSLLVTPSVLERSRALLEPCCARRVEGCLLWYGYVLDAETCVVTTCVRPTQTGYPKTYEISAASMREVRQHVRPHRLLLLVQIHSHPTEAFFSDRDEQHALNNRAGALNMIVPNYGTAHWIDIDSFCMVERNDGDAWRRWSGADWSRLVFVPDLIELPIKHD